LGLRGTRRQGEWRKLHNEELNDLHCSPTIVWVMKSKRMRWAGHVARRGEGRAVYRVLVGKPMGRPRRGWEDNIKADLREVGCGEYGLDGAGAGERKVAGTWECGNEPSGSIKCKEFLD
jgi:hypothetical protein